MGQLAGNDLVGCFAEYRTEIYRFVFRIVGCEDTAHDLVQDTYLRLFDYVSEQEIQNPRAFIYKIANNLALDYLRSQKRRTAMIDSSEMSENPLNEQALAEDPQTIVLQQQQLDLLSNAIQKLPAITQDVFVRSRFLGQTHEQISRELGISKSWVEKNIMQALSECRRVLDRPEIKK